MVKYIFYDTDASGSEEYDLCGEDYKNLIQTCCKYCKTFSVIVSNFENPIVSKLQKFLIPAQDNIEFKYPHYGNNLSGVCYYNICSELCDILLQSANGIFEWIDGWNYNNPNDPTFYRNDGSVFFTSTIHEGICVLIPRENEDVTNVVQNVHWIKAN